MCCENNILKPIISSLIIILLIILIVVSINNQNPDKTNNILVAIARNGDNTTLGTTTIKFSQNQIVEGSALSHLPGSNEIMINEDGIYQISYQLEGIAKSTGTFNFNAILLVNGTPISDTLNEGPVIVENIGNNRMTLTSTVILKLNAGDVLQLGGLSQENITYPTARIDIEKID